MSVAEAAMPASALRFLAVAAANTLIYAEYAMLWVCSACGVFVVVRRRALGEGSLFLSSSTTVSLYPALCSFSVVPFSRMFVAAHSMAPVSNNTDATAKERTEDAAVKGHRQILLKSLRVMLQDVVMVGLSVSALFLMILGAGGMAMGTSHVISSILIDVGILGANGLQCFIILPVTALRRWRVKY